VLAVIISLEMNHLQIKHHFYKHVIFPSKFHLYKKTEPLTGRKVIGKWRANTSRCKRKHFQDDITSATDVIQEKGDKVARPKKIREAGEGSREEVL